MTGLLSRLRGLRQPAHIGWGGDPRDPFTTCWNPDPKGEIR